MVNKTLGLLVLLSLIQPILAEQQFRKNQSSFAAAYATLPTAANTPGQFGAYFKTRLSILNVTGFTYPVKATLYGPQGRVASIEFALVSHESKSWDNFLAEFDYVGAGEIELDAWFATEGKSEYCFLVTAEVYTDSPAGRYKTLIGDSSSLDSISPSFEAFSPGVSVNERARTNLGCFNDSLLPQTVRAELYQADGHLLNAYILELEEHAWKQIGMPDRVDGGYIKWTPESLCYCWAVVVDNKSNDGTLIPGRSLIP